MRLYQDSKGRWYGTQAGARKAAPRDWREVDVPTSKQELINWLSIHEVGAVQKALAPEPQPPAQPSPSKLDPHVYSWVAWALETLQRGNKSDAEEMLKKGLKLQKQEAECFSDYERAV